MPANNIVRGDSIDMNTNMNNGTVVVGLEDQRALQIALELTMLGLSSSDIESNEDLNDMSEEVHKKKSQNMTECVPVPSSEHVAEIVGRQGQFSSCV